MSSFPAPTYVVGVHERLETAYVISVHAAMRAKLPSITTGHELNLDALRRLWEEVRAYWHGRDMTRPVSHFVN